MKTDGNTREKPLPIFVAVFSHLERERERDTRERDGNRDIQVYRNEQIRTGYDGNGQERVLNRDDILQYMSTITQHI